MPEYIDKEKYCAEVCKCNEEKCDKSKCPIWNAPAADVAPVVHGKWIEVTRSVYCGMNKQGNPIYRDRNVYYCSKCSRKTVIKEKCCPNCGAKMDLKEDK